MLKSKTREATDFIVIHCTATKPDLDVGAKDIDAWHRKRGWLRIGYHFVIRRNGVVEVGRNEDEIGAHVQGHNWHSVSICMAGGVDHKGKPQNNFNPEQFAALRIIVDRLRKKYPNAKVVGHRDLSPDKDNDGKVEQHEWLKACPSFDVAEWMAREFPPSTSPRSTSNTST